MLKSWSEELGVQYERKEQVDIENEGPGSEDHSVAISGGRPQFASIVSEGEP